MTRAGVRTEVLVSLGVVMLLATVVLTTVLVVHQERMLRDLLGRALLAEARSPQRAGEGFVPGTEWWLVHRNGHAQPHAPLGGGIDALSQELAERARREGRPLLQPGAVWQEIRFAAPLEGREIVAVGRLPRDASARLRLRPLGVIAAVLVVDVLVFGAFGATLLRRRLIGPLQRLAAGARAVAEDSRETRVPEEGVREVAGVARAFNEMTEALERRTADLEKAVVDLRHANEELHETRAGLERTQRLAAVGQLAAGVAHEIGNPMGAILALLDLAGRDPNLGDGSRGHLERAGREGERVRVILRQLLDFSRPRRAEPVALDLRAAAEETLGLVSAQRRFLKVAFELGVEDEPPAAHADRGAVAQILLNLVLNAAEAARDGDEAPRVRLTVRGAARRARAGDTREADQATRARRSADAVECLIADNGGGISEEDAERIFDPFFTTRPPGEGTGLGLPNAARLAEEQGGAVDRVEAPEGFRTAFVLRLPAHRAADSARAGRRSATRATSR
jgi:signal transduction histidine kinase